MAGEFKRYLSQENEGVRPLYVNTKEKSALDYLGLFPGTTAEGGKFTQTTSPKTEKDEPFPHQLLGIVANPTKCVNGSRYSMFKSMDELYKDAVFAKNVDLEQD